MLCQNRRRHAADTARNRCCRRSSSFQIGKIHIAAEFSIFIYIDPNVNDNRILFYIGVVDHRCFSHAGSQNIRLPAYLRQTGSSRVADGHGRVLGEQQQGDRLADDEAAADHDHALALQTLHALRSAQAAVLAAHAARLVVAPREHLAVLRQRDGVDVARAHLHLPLTARLLPYEAVSLQALHLLRTTRLLHSAGETHHDPSLVTQTTERGAAPRPHGAVGSHGSHVTVAHRAVDHRLTVEGVLDLARQDLVGAVLRVSLAQLVAVSLAERPQTTSLGDHGGG